MIALVIGLTAALGLLALGLGVFVLGQPPPAGRVARLARPLPVWCGMNTHGR